MLGEELDHMGDLRPFWDDIYHPSHTTPSHVLLWHGGKGLWRGGSASQLNVKMCEIKDSNIG